MGRLRRARETPGTAWLGESKTSKYHRPFVMRRWGSLLVPQLLPSAVGLPGPVAATTALAVYVVLLTAHSVLWRDAAL